MSNGKVLWVTSDRSLLSAVAPTMTGRGFDLQPVDDARDAVMRLMGGLPGVVVDVKQLRPGERESLIEVHKSRTDFALILLETLGTLSPNEPAALRRLGLPLPTGFADQVRVCPKPVVFLVDPGVFASNAVQAALQEAGVQVLNFENTLAVMDVLVQNVQAEHKAQAEAQARNSQPKSFWEKLGGGSGGVEAPPSMPKVAVARFTGNLAEAEAFDARLRQTLPQAVCYAVTGIDSIAEAVKSIRASFPASIMREDAAKVAGILADGFQSVAAARQKPRLLIVDNNKAMLEVYAQALAPNGYDVVPIHEAERVLTVAAKPGLFNLVVLGLPVTFTPNSSLELAKKLRERDPNLAILLLVDPLPAPTATQAMSQASSLGVDEALLKPVHPAQLLRSIQRALEHRFLLLENARLLSEVLESNRKLAQVNGFQTKFFAMVAHDVKNPLTAILGYSEVLGMRLKEPQELKCASHIHSAAKTLNLLISDLVDLAAIESGKLRVSIGPLDFPAVLAEVRGRIDVVAQKRKIRFSIECPANLPPLAGDPARLGQVIQNLCTNGIQYTNEGGSVSVRVDPTPDFVVVSVYDTGIGIKKEDIPRVFERFFQSTEAQEMRKAGFGLGLKIAREIVQMHGGEMGLESEFGKGSRFYFTLPVQRQLAPEPPAPPYTPVPPAPPRLQ